MPTHNMNLKERLNNMEALWNSSEIAEATGGKAHGEWSVSGVSINTRTIEKGDLFIAIRGENLDGHDFVKEAFAKGAGAALVSDKECAAKHDNIVLVNDTMKAMESMAVYSRSRMNGKIIAVTGSVGKTSTKEMLALALTSEEKEVFSSYGNLNNNFGVPLSLCRMPKTTKYGIFEMGMNHPGEIVPLSKMARPDIAIITTVEAVHLEFFSSVAEIADAKSEIFAGLKNDGVVILNKANEHFDRLVNKAHQYGIKNIISFGTNDSDSHVISDNNGAISAEILGSKVSYSLGSLGRHQVTNSLAVITAAKLCGEDLQQAAGKLLQFSSPAGRGKISEVKLKNGSNIRIIDDSYNASPASVAAAIANLHNVKGGIRYVAVLGSMFELGHSGPLLHKRLAENIVDNKVDIVFAVGDLMKNLYDAIPAASRGEYFADSEIAAREIYSHLRDGDIVLVKGSRGMRMEKIINYLMENYAL